MLIRTPQDAERAACEWMRANGFPDARLTPDGADGGVDVRSREAVAQVKAQVGKQGRPTVQALKGIAAHEGRQALFFSLGGFTPDALGWATDADVAAFEFDLQGDVRPLNWPARRIVEAVRTDGGGVTVQTHSFQTGAPTGFDWMKTKWFAVVAGFLMLIVAAVVASIFF